MRAEKHGRFPPVRTQARAAQINRSASLRFRRLFAAI
jgi:hypothetical protein